MRKVDGKDNKDVNKKDSNDSKSGEGGDADWYLGARITQKSDNIILDQEQYTIDILKKFSRYLGSNENKKTSTPLVADFQKYLIQAEKIDEIERS